MGKKNNAVTTHENTGVIYTRYSSHNQREESNEAQIRACMEYAKNNGIKIIGTYTDSAKTGTNSDRKQFLQMMEDSGKGVFKYLLVHKLDCFSRSKYDSAVYKRKLKENNVKLISVAENIGDTAEGLVLESVLEGMAQYYSMNLAREVMKGMKESAYKCTHLGGTPPLGYDVDPVTKKYIINEQEAVIICTIFEKYADGVGYNQILEYLNGRGYKTKTGRPFGKGSLNAILHNEKYMGKFIFNKKLEKDVFGKRRPQLKPEEEWIVVENGLPAIIDKKTFDKVQAKLSYNLKNGGKFKAKEIYLLSGVIFCGECGSSMYGNTRMCGRGKTKYSSYRCSLRAQHKGCANKELRKEYLDNFVLDQLHQKLFTDVSIRKLSKMLNEYNQRKSMETNEELNIVNNELSEVTKKISNIIHLVSESGISIDTVKDELRLLEDRKRFLEDYIRDITLSTKASMVTEDIISDLISRSKEFLQTKNIPECRNFIQNYVDKVMVYNDRVEVFFKINVPDNNAETISPLKSEEDIKALQKEYRSIV